MFSCELDRDANDHGTDSARFCAIAQLFANLGSG